MSGVKRHVPNGLSREQLRAREQANTDQQHVITRCAFCNWTYEGTAYEGRELARGHRRVHHPDAVAVRKRHRILTRHQSRDDGWRVEGLANAAEVAGMLARREGQAA